MAAARRPGSATARKSCEGPSRGCRGVSVVEPCEPRPGQRQRGSLRPGLGGVLGGASAAEGQGHRRAGLAAVVTRTEGWGRGFGPPLAVPLSQGARGPEAFGDCGPRLPNPAARSGPATTWSPPVGPGHPSGTRVRRRVPKSRQAIGCLRVLLGHQVFSFNFKINFQQLKTKDLRSHLNKYVSFFKKTLYSGSNCDWSRP
jgi:hypothetical protein